MRLSYSGCWFRAASATILMTTLCACKLRPDASAVKIVGGSADNGQHQAVVQLAMLKSAPTDNSTPTGSGNCTGTIVAPNLVLTAAHCFAEPNAAFAQVVGVDGITLSPANPTSIDFVLFPNYTQITGGPSVNLTNDLAFAIFPAGTFDRSVVAQIAATTEAVAAADLVTLVGYGYTDATNSATASTIAMAGTNKIATLEASYGNALCLTTTAVSATSVCAAPGDSGSPLFNSAGHIIGTNYGGMPVANNAVSATAPEFCFYVNISSGSAPNKQGATAFIAEVLADPSPSKSSAQDVSTMQVDQSGPINCIQGGGNSSPQPQASSAGSTTASPQGGYHASNGQTYPYCTNGSNTGNNFGWQPELGGSCRVPGT